MCVGNGIVGASAWRQALWLSGLGLSVNYLLFIIDDTPRFFFGDSASYLATRLDGHLPIDRSWLYGVAVQWVMATTGSLSSVLLLQGALYVVALSAIGAALRSETAASWTGIVFCLLGVLDPLTLYHQRAILTDLPAASFFLLSLFFVYRLLISKPFPRIGMVSDVLGLSLSAAVAVSLRSAYLPVLAGVGLMCLLLTVFATFRLKPWPSLVPSAPLAVAAAIVAAVALVLTVNNAVNPALGFSLNRSSNAFMLGVLSPAVRRSMLAKEGFQISRSNFQQFRLRDMNLRAAQIFWPTGLVPVLKKQMAGLSPDQAEEQMGQLVKRIIVENPTGVARILLRQFIMNLDLRSYLFHFPSLLWLDQRTFDAGFVERFVHPYAWQKIDQSLPAQTTMSELILRRAGLLVWLQYLIAVFAPLGMIFGSLRRSPLYLVVSLAASGYALSTVLFSTATIARYFVPLAPLSLAVIILLLSQVSKHLGTAEGSPEKVF
jgi:hypothetical protein